ncbi:MAG: hypothetical protein WBA39_33165 [Rivularia sp. (in: cyanobacteria)]
MVKDKISLIAAAAGGFMLFVAMASILQGAPVMALRSQHNFDSTKVADLRLQTIYPDERFYGNNSLERSFRALTEKSKPVLGSQAVSEVENTDWDTQTLGFNNWVGSLEGTLKKQDYQIKKLGYQLAQKQYEDKAIPQSLLNQKQAAYNKAQKDFQVFVESSLIAD